MNDNYYAAMIMEAFRDIDRTATVPAFGYALNRLDQAINNLRNDVDNSIKNNNLDYYELCEAFELLKYLEDIENCVVRVSNLIETEK